MLMVTMVFIYKIASEMKATLHRFRRYNQLTTGEHRFKMLHNPHAIIFAYNPLQLQFDCNVGKLHLCCSSTGRPGASFQNRTF
jgi:hypothetical protein